MDAEPVVLKLSIGMTRQALDRLDAFDVGEVSGVETLVAGDTFQSPVCGFPVGCCINEEGQLSSLLGHGQGALTVAHQAVRSRLGVGSLCAEKESSNEGPPQSNAQWALEHVKSGFSQFHQNGRDASGGGGVNPYAKKTGLNC